MEFILQILTSLSMVLGDPMLPTEKSPDWEALSPWEMANGYFHTSSSSQSIVEECRINPEKILITPIIIQGFHQFYLDGELVAQSGKSDGNGARMNNSLSLNCNEIAHGRELRWSVTANTRPLAKLASYPELHDKINLSFILTHVTPIATAAVLLVLGITIFALFSATEVGHRINLPFFASNLLVSVHFALTVPDVFGIEMRDIDLHRLHDVLIWSGVSILIATLRMIDAVPGSLQRLQMCSSVLAIAVIALSNNLSQSQVGSTFAFIGNILIFTFLMPLALKKFWREGKKKPHFYQLLAISCFSMASLADFGTHLGAWQLPPLYALGYIGPLVFITLAINQDISATYRERDSLRQGLEAIVDEKTRELKEQSSSLEEAYNDLRNLKADAIQSARLAALGTLSAGIAHEINNSLNYVNGSLTPLRNLVSKAPLSDVDKSKATRLFELMSEGLTLTFNIIRNLKNQAASGTGEMEDVPIRAAIEGTLLLLKNKIPEHIATRVSIDPTLKARATQTGLTQVATNLIGNAIDALIESKKAAGLVEVSAVECEDGITLLVRDNGPGIPHKAIDRIFEPFFTTKAEGKGTGLGLHLVRTELEKMQASVHVESSVGVGTEFLVKFKKAQKPSTAVEERAAS